MKEQKMKKLNIILTGWCVMCA